MKRPNPLSTLALAVALLALVVSLGGASYAAKLITGKQIKNNSITAKDIKKNTLTGKQIKDGSLSKADLPAGTVPATVFRRLAATPGANEAAAVAAAPRVDLYTKGALSVYAKCYTDLSGPTTYASIYIRSGDNFAVFDGDEDDLGGGPALTDWLGGATLESDRELMTTDVGANNATYYGNHSSDFNAAAGATTIGGLLAVGAKNGTLTAGNGLYGAGDACLISGYFTSN